MHTANVRFPYPLIVDWVGDCPVRNEHKMASERRNWTRICYVFPVRFSPLALHPGLQPDLLSVDQSSWRSVAKKMGIPWTKMDARLINTLRSIESSAKISKNSSKIGHQPPRNMNIKSLHPRNVEGTSSSSGPQGQIASATVESNKTTLLAKKWQQFDVFRCMSLHQ